MMKKLIFLLFIFGISNAFAQTDKPKVVEVQTRERTFTGKIDGKYAITIYLKWQQFFGDDSEIYSVKGWYYYDNKKIKIPLVGIYDGELTLFASPSAEKSRSVLQLRYEKPADSWEVVELVKNSPGYEEKFVLSVKDEQSFSGKWSNGKIESEVAGSGNISIYNRQEFLRFPGKTNPKSINLYGLNLDITNFSFKSVSKFDEKESRVLLAYSFVSNNNHQGKCGAGYENGFVVLHLDKNLEVLSTEDFRTYSCLENIENETDGNNKNAINITKYNGNTISHEKIKVDVPNAKITKLTP